MEIKNLSWPLMSNNVTADDRNAMIEFLKTDAFLTNGPRVREFEEAWSKWLGVKYSVFVNSGASANLLTMTWVKNNIRTARVLVPAVTWVSDIATVLQNDLKPVFADISLKTLGIEEKYFPTCQVAFVTHLLGFSAFTKGIQHEVPYVLIEDCCESHGATFNGKKLGTFGLISNFSFYFAHHMSTIEGGMICTNDEEIYEEMRTLRSHGLLREIRSQSRKDKLATTYPHLSDQFIFLRSGYNVRNNEIGAVLGLSQLRRLDENNEKRRQNFEIFLNELSRDSGKFITDFHTEGSCNYALTLILKEADHALRTKLEAFLKACEVEFRRGLSGGGNQLRQPYLEAFKWNKDDFPNAEHVSDYGWYIGNYPDLAHDKIRDLCRLLRQF
jgi:CDP-4-dehydro-6-deoxyglucose reductase, E1